MFPLSVATGPVAAVGQQLPNNYGPWSQLIVRESSRQLAAAARIPTCALSIACGEVSKQELATLLWKAPL